MLECSCYMVSLFIVACYSATQGPRGRACMTPCFWVILSHTCGSVFRRRRSYADALDRDLCWNVLAICFPCILCMLIFYIETRGRACMTPCFWIILSHTCGSVFRQRRYIADALDRDLLWSVLAVCFPGYIVPSTLLHRDQGVESARQLASGLSIPHIWERFE